ncbi:sugar phosphate isomerase/epimerase [Jiella sp. MQZ9-1]|uniref:TIM barrel protein n=1 Tax=Jiella flava TaxID=2816857 RepID=A0A939FYB7_9HYPH|nr:TIM barrel protein [Jiella flava]MBO0662986.1 TIM barrel protein [Jiella flava]MCD2471254.1 sugar phosphate isomerase/epimerase [Jiella flava]
MTQNFTLSISTNPLVNRFALPERLIAAAADEIGIGYLQLTHEFLNPSWPSQTLAPLVDRMGRALAGHDVKVTSMMTGPYGRLNHFGHPDADVRAYYITWFKTLADIAADLGCPAIGTQFAILTYDDYDDIERRNALLRIALDCWREVGEHAAKRGLSWMFWEPMSVGRELGHTLEACAALQAFIERHDLPIPLRPMVDIDHGDVSSANPADIDPFAWARTFATASPIIHIKQSSANKGGHWPFTEAYNRDGRIMPETLLPAIVAGGGTDNEICLELAFREREPTDRQVVAALAESVAFWANAVDAGRPVKA